MTFGNTVLVIDDDPIALEVVRERLTAAGFHVVVREEALGTVQAVRELRPDLVLLDVMMPALTGESVATLLKGNPYTRGVGIILHSSKSEVELAGLIEQTGALGSIRKTDDDEDFISRFLELASRHTARPRR